MPTPSDVAVRPFWADLARHGDRPALLTPTGTLSYAELAQRVEARSLLLGTTRRLVVVEGGGGVDTVVSYLAALAGRHPAILVPDARSVEGYDPDVVCRGEAVEIRRDGSAHDLHPELALLLSTSGSTGSPKLVRLSAGNLAANAAAIADYLGIRVTDVAPATLPLHYCYGLSVLNSHLAVGASVLLSTEPVTSPEFWSQFRAAGCTTLAGVPYTFECLDRVGFAEMELPSLRYLTQAGGRMDPSAVRRYAALGQLRGFDLFVMYGATEATSRMAYLPPDLALSCPNTVGVPIPGGSVRVEDGELVYSGPNVMLGYAETPADLARGREVHELRTGDLGRIRPDGLVEVTGRASRIAKILGLRVDLDRVEQSLAADGHLIQCVDGDDHLVVAVDVSARPCPSDLQDRVAAASGLPAGRIRLLPLERVPRLPSGKPDQARILALASDHKAPQPLRTAGDLRALYAEVLRRDAVTPDDSFVSLHGDSLSYVELSVRLEQALGTLPPHWQDSSIRSLSQRSQLTQPRRPSWGRVLESSVVLRAAAILLIVASHADVIAVMGGAHVLLALLGFNAGRFLVTGAPRRERVRKLVRSTGRMAVPAMAWLALVLTFDPGVGWRNVLLLNGVLGPDDWGDSWQYWFVEVAVYLFLGLALLTAVPLFDRLERRWPFWTPYTLAVLAATAPLTVSGDDVREYRAHVIAWLFLLGWAAAKAQRDRQRLLVSALLLVTVPGFFELGRTGVIVGGILLLVWVPTLRVPSLLAKPLAVLASASLAIYLTHWQVYPAIENAGHQVLATVAAIAVGVSVWWLAARAVNVLVATRPWVRLRPPRRRRRSVTDYRGAMAT